MTMAWQDIPRDVRYLIMFGLLFVTVLILILLVSYGMGSEKKPQEKTYILDGVKKVKVTTTTTSTRKLLPTLCQYAADHNDCDNLQKFQLTRQQCCQEVGVCCEN